MPVRTKNENVKKLNMHDRDHIASCLCCKYNRARSCEKGHYTEATRQRAHGLGPVCEDYEGRKDD